MKRALRIVLVVLSIIAALAQFYPVERSNPPVRADLDAPPEVRKVLRSACYDCHSNETRWPWYSHVAPASWLVHKDVRRARGEMNLSEWGLMRPKDRARLREEMWEEIEAGNMPLPIYRLVHPGARLTEEQRDVLRRWMLANEYDPATGSPGGRGGRGP